MKIVIDMNLSPVRESYLRQHGYEAVHWSGIGPINAPDSHILNWAADRDHVVLTHDLDFGAILAASGARTPSVIQARVQDVSPEGMGELILQALAQFAADLSAGALLVISSRGNRVRMLPLTLR